MHHTKTFSTKPSLIELIGPLIAEHKLFKNHLGFYKISTDKTHHILSLLHECYKPQSETLGFLDNTIPSTVDLDRAGVSFNPNKDPTWVMEMEVKSYGWFPCRSFDSWSNY